MSIEIATVIAVIGCIVGVAGWFLNRDKRLSADAEWRGQVNGKLDIIVGIRNDVDRMDEKLSDYGERISKVEASVKQAHKRLDDHLKP